MAPYCGEVYFTRGGANGEAVYLEAGMSYSGKAETARGASQEVQILGGRWEDGHFEVQVLWVVHRSTQWINALQYFQEVRLCAPADTWTAQVELGRWHASKVRWDAYVEEQQEVLAVEEEEEEEELPQQDFAAQEEQPRRVSPRETDREKKRKRKARQTRQDNTKDAAPAQFIARTSAAENNAKATGGPASWKSRARRR